MVLAVDIRYAVVVGVNWHNGCPDLSQVSGDELPFEFEPDEEEKIASSPSAAQAPRLSSRCQGP